MDLTPGEKAVLAQIRVLYYNAAKREQQVKAVLGLWPPTHYESRFYGDVGPLTQRYPWRDYILLHPLLSSKVRLL